MSWLSYYFLPTFSCLTNNALCIIKKKEKVIQCFHCLFILALLYEMLVHFARDLSVVNIYPKSFVFVFCFYVIDSIQLNN